MSSSSPPATSTTVDDEERYEILREYKRTLTQVLEEAQDDLPNAALNETRGTSGNVREMLIWVERVLWHGLHRRQPRLAPREGSSPPNALEEPPPPPPLFLWHLAEKWMKPARDHPDLGGMRAVAQTMGALKNVSTDKGRSRAWVRACLNHGVLGSCWRVVMRNLTARNAVRAYYDGLSIWASGEQASIAFSLLDSLAGVSFDLDVDLARYDETFEPSRRPHLLGVSGRRLKIIAPSPAASSSPTRDGNGEPPSSSSLGKEELARRQAMREAEELRNKIHGGGGGDGAANKVDSSSSFFASIFQKAVSLVVQPTANASPSSTPTVPTIPPPPPSLLGSTLEQLIHDPRTCENALLDPEIGIPDAVSRLLAMIELDESGDPFDPGQVANEDDPKFSREVAALLARLSPGGDSRAPVAPEYKPSAVAFSSLKLILRQLREPLIPYDSYDAFLECQRIGETGAKIRNVKLLVDQLPALHKPTLMQIADVVGIACETGRTNPIAAANALTSCLLRPRPGPVGGLGRAAEASEIVSLFIEHRHAVFAEVAAFVEDHKRALMEKISHFEARHLDSFTPVDFARDRELFRTLWNAATGGGATSTSDEQQQGDGNKTRGLEFPDAPISEKWRAVGFRTSEVCQDFRGGGRAALLDLVYLAESFPHFYRARTAPSTAGFAADRSKEYPFFLAATQMSRATSELIGYDLGSPRAFDIRPVSESKYWRALHATPHAASRLFCVLMVLLEHEWVRQRGSVSTIDFNRVKREVILALDDAYERSRAGSCHELEVYLERTRGVDFTSARRNDDDEGAGGGEKLRRTANESVKSPAPSSSHSVNVGTPAQSHLASSRGGERNGETRSNEGEKTPSQEETEEEDDEDRTAGGGDDENVLPRLLPLQTPSTRSAVKCMRKEFVVPLEAALAPEYRGYDWDLAFSSELHGFNVDKFYERAGSHQATLLLIADRDSDAVFGGFASAPWKQHHDEYFGTGQCFIFTFPANGGGKAEVYNWTGANDYFMYSSTDSIAMGGGGGGFGFFIDGDLRGGTSAPCKTYGNPHALLPARQAGEEEGGEVEFVAASIELWYFIPKNLRRNSLS